MIRTILRHMISAFGLLTFISAFASSAVSAPSNNPFEIRSYSWGVATPQTLRVCVNSLPSGVGKDVPTETDSIFYVIDVSGSILLKRELRVPPAGFQCLDIPYVELVRAGLQPDPMTGALTFRVDILHPSSRGKVGVGANQILSPIGAVMNIRATTGQIETYEATWQYVDDVSVTTQ